eukprot:GFYU01039197.1.p1 GENE.GFYU01039197.1~~GFYU01039197.1.p1  ORF type:complete len:266 (-),score=26.50 GFYU01039197.1:41-721(-)
MSMNAPTHSIQPSTTPTEPTISVGNKAVQPIRGLMIFKGFLSVDEQQDLIGTVEQLGYNQGGFYNCNNEKTKDVKMMTLGYDADPTTSTYRIKTPVPGLFKDLASRIVSLAASQGPIPRRIDGNVCVVNHYVKSSKLGLHQDTVTRKNPRVPVVSISIGDSATFRYKKSWSKKEKLKDIVVESGDVMVFGGPARNIHHGVCNVEPSTAPSALTMTPGRYCITIRQF